MSDADVRACRTRNTLSFEPRVSDIWIVRHSVAVPSGSAASEAGRLIATDASESVQVASDEALFVDPSAGQEAMFSAA